MDTKYLGYLGGYAHYLLYLVALQSSDPSTSLHTFQGRSIRYDKKYAKKEVKFINLKRANTWKQGRETPPRNKNKSVSSIVLW